MIPIALATAVIVSTKRIQVLRRRELTATANYSFRIHREARSLPAHRPLVSSS